MKTKLKKTLGKFINSLNQLQSIVFSCYIKRDYFANRYDYEKQIHRVRIQLFHHMKKMRLLCGDQPLSSMENLYEIIFSLNVFKLRVADHATFEVCENEMKLFTQCISAILTNACDSRFRENDSMAQLSSAINNFEELYRSTLQVVSYEPIVFLYFVQNMIALREGLDIFLRDFIYA